MAQFYFLSVLFNIIVGLVLLYGRDLTVYASAGDEDAQIPASEDFEEAEDSVSDDDDFGDFGGEAVPARLPAPKTSLENFSVFNNRVFRLVTGVLSMFVAIIKLLSPMDVPFIGDIVPAFAGLLGGFAFLVEYYAISTDGSSLNETVESIFIDSRKFLGIICLVVGVIHFLIPRVVLL
ncbi:MAG: hypothetical protein K6G18_07060 [Treponema sp.]|nr:hypothetical protein [Treponema sp.]MCR5621599.1 hypothetical protein [Treponema sp.]